MSHDEKRALPDNDSAERSVARLLKLSGERRMPATEATARAHAAAVDAWQASLHSARVHKRRQGLLRIAAVIAVVAVGAVAWNISSISSRAIPIVAHAVIVNGDTTLVTRAGEGHRLIAGAALEAHSLLATQEDGAALEVGDSLSLRIDKHSRLRLVARNEVVLLAGTIYVDSGGLSAHSELRIRTPAGEVRHEGTQYQVSVKTGQTHIQVREGRVRFTDVAQARAAHIVAGEELDVDAQGNLQRRAAVGFGPEWEWASALATPLDTENRPLVEFLAWMAREHGWQLRYATPRLEREVQSIRLHGVTQGSTPEQTLQRVALITGLPMRVDDGVLVIGAN
jgi:ferric-dicitrate binding protein FerR (iron transport regulator)